MSGTKKMKRTLLLAKTSLLKLAVCKTNKKAVEKPNSPIRTSLVHQHPTAKLCCTPPFKHYHSSLVALDTLITDEEVLVTTSTSGVDAHTLTGSLSTVEGEEVAGTSTSTLEVTKPTTTLELTKFELWTSEQVGDWLVLPKERGGVGLSDKAFEPLYEAGFDGASLANIVRNIQDKDKFYALDQLKTSLKDSGLQLSFQLSNTCQTVVNWVDALVRKEMTTLSAGKGKDNRDISTDLSFSYMHNPFVNRHNELLQLLTHAFKRYSRGKPALVHSVSAPGMGKSTLLAQCMNQLTNHHNKVVIFRFLNGVGKDETNITKWYDDLIRGLLSLSPPQTKKIQFLNSIHRCLKVGDYVGVNLNYDLKKVISSVPSIASPEFGNLALCTILKVGLARKYSGQTILFNKQRYDIKVPSSKCDLKVIETLPTFITQKNDPEKLLTLWKTLSQQNPVEIDLLFKHYGIQAKHCLYIAIDEIQEISISNSKYDGMYYLLSAILDIWDNVNYDVFVLSAGVSINHSFLKSKAIEHNYPPTPLVDRKCFEEILVIKFGKQLYKKNSRVRKESMLDSELSDALLMGFYNCGGIARCISGLLIIFEPLINNDGKVEFDMINKAVIESERAIDRYLNGRKDYFEKLSDVQKAMLIWLTVVPLGLSKTTCLTVPGKTVTQYNPTLEDLQQVCVVVPFSRSEHINYYIPYFVRTQLQRKCSIALTELLANNDGSQVCDLQYLFINPHIPGKAHSSNDPGKNLDMITINSIWCIYKYYKLSSKKVTLKNLFPDIPHFGQHRSDELFVEWEGMKLLNHQFDYRDASNCIELNYLYKNCDGAQHGDVLFIAKTNSGEQVKVAIECSMRNEDQLSLTNLINLGINVLFGRSHKDLKLKKQKEAVNELNNQGQFTDADIICKDKILELKKQSVFDVLILLAPFGIQYDKPKGGLQKKYKTVCDFWQKENQLIVFNGRGTIHEHTLKYVKEEL